MTISKYPTNFMLNVTIINLKCDVYANLTP